MNAMRRAKVNRSRLLVEIVETVVLIGCVVTIVVAIAALAREAQLFERDSALQDERTTLSFGEQMDLLEKLKDQATKPGSNETEFELIALIQLPDGVGKRAIEAFIEKWQEKNWQSDKRRSWSGKRSLLLFLRRNR
jgi:hypothetical protein